MATLVRWRYVVLAVLGLLVWVASSTTVTPDNDWQFFTWGGDLLFGHDGDFRRSDVLIRGDLPGGLQVYANYPVLQIGPPALLVGHFMDVGPHDGAVLAGLVIQALCLLAVLAVERAAARGGVEPCRLGFVIAAGGAAVTMAWAGIGHYSHLDDAVTLAAGCCGAWALSSRRPWLAGVLIGLAASSKPWGIALLGLCLVPEGRRGKAIALSAASTVICCFWLPFVLAAPETLALGDNPVFVDAGSVLRAVGVESVAHPDRLRLAQLGGGLLVAVVMVACGRWWWAPLAAFSLRLALDPGSHDYYGTAVVVAALLVDACSGRRAPVLALGTTGLWVLAASLGPQSAGKVRACEYTALLVLCLASALPARDRARSTRSSNWS